MNLPRMARRALGALLAALVALGSLSAGAESVVTTRKTRAYLAPSAGSPSVAIPAGVVLTQTAEKSGWIRVKRGEVTAYMAASDVDEIVGLGAVAGYLTEAAPLYKAYGKAAKYGTIPSGAKVTVYALAGDWALAGYRGCRGFVAKSALSASEPAQEQSPAPEVTVTKGLTAYVKNDGAKVYQSWSTSSKVLGKLNANTKLAVGAVRGDWALVGRSGRRGFMQLSDLSREKVSAPPAPSKPIIALMDWWTSGIQEIFARGVTATITDVDTEISWREVRKGGTNHADCQPLTAQDTANMKRACGGKWSWDRRAVIVTINGQHYAASMNCMPHGGGSITGNNYNGHHCYHFLNSRTSTGAKPDPAHQAAIQKAVGRADGH